MSWCEVNKGDKVQPIEGRKVGRYLGRKGGREEERNEGRVVKC